MNEYKNVGLSNIPLAVTDAGDILHLHIFTLNIFTSSKLKWFSYCI